MIRPFRAVPAKAPPAKARSATAGSAARPAFAVEAAPPGAADWDDLSRRAGAAHPHYARHTLDAHRAAGLLPADLRWLLVRRGGRLDALLYI